MNPTDTIVLITLVLLGAVSAASASRIGGTLPSRCSSHPLLSSA
ncbi:hypothetical protein [Deinococcus sp. JMULE3]|nr:hypothetical protein [Deinococcus sp. JMULE3]